MLFSHQKVENAMILFIEWLWNIYTIFQKHTLYIKDLPDHFPKCTPSEKHIALRTLFTKCVCSHYINTSEKWWNLHSATKKSSRTCSREHNIFKPETDVQLHEAQFLEALFVLGSITQMLLLERPSLTCIFCLTWYNSDLAP